MTERAPALPPSLSILKIRRVSSENAVAPKKDWGHRVCCPSLSLTGFSWHCSLNPSLGGAFAGGAAAHFRISFLHQNQVKLRASLSCWPHQAGRQHLGVSLSSHKQIMLCAVCIRGTESDFNDIEHVYRQACLDFCTSFGLVVYFQAPLVSFLECSHTFAPRQNLT